MVSSFLCYGRGLGGTRPAFIFGPRTIFFKALHNYDFFFIYGIMDIFFFMKSGFWVSPSWFHDFFFVLNGPFCPKIWILGG
jgi:hypothetical protein